MAKIDFNFLYSLLLFVFFTKSLRIALTNLGGFTQMILFILHLVFTRYESKTPNVTKKKRTAKDSF